MEAYFTGKEKVESVVEAFPGATQLLRKAHIDFCVDGDLFLMQAIEVRELDADRFLGKLNSSFEQAKRRSHPDRSEWRRTSVYQLIMHIVYSHHRYLHSELPLLRELIGQLRQSKGTLYPELVELQQRFQGLQQRMERQMTEEEEGVFPLLLAFGEHPTPDRRQRVAARIEALQPDYQAVSEDLQAIRQLTDDFAWPEGACKTHILAYRKLAELEFDLHEHLHLELQILYPRV